MIYLFIILKAKCFWFEGLIRKMIMLFIVCFLVRIKINIYLGWKSCIVNLTYDNLLLCLLSLILNLFLLDHLLFPPRSCLSLNDFDYAPICEIKMIEYLLLLELYRKKSLSQNTVVIQWLLLHRLQLLLRKLVEIQQ